MKKWTTFIAVIMALCLCVGLIVYAEEQIEQVEQVEETETESEVIDFNFYVTALTNEQYAHIESNYSKAEFCLLGFLYIDNSGVEQVGEMITNRNIAYDVLNALQNLYEAKLPIWDIGYFVGDGFDVTFTAPLISAEPEQDLYNMTFGQFGFSWNDNQFNGIRHYTIETKINDWYPDITSGLL
jgi:hypothetical protein